MKITTISSSGKNKKIVLIIAFRNFRDEEYFIPREILEKNNIEIETASTEIGTAIGINGGEANVNLKLSELQVQRFDAVVFIGGPGMAEKLDDEHFQKIAQQVLKLNKILAAICISPVLLAKAGVLKGKRATVWSSALDKEPVRTLKQGGAIYQDEPVVVDEKLITANGPDAAKEFGEALIKLLKKT